MRLMIDCVNRSVILLLLFHAAVVSIDVVHALDDSDKDVTCGSAVKLTHVESGGTYMLHSENKNMGSGSGQQIVTWNSDKSSTGSLWRLRMENDREGDECEPGTPLRCGSTIRLTHLNTQRNLHTHAIPSPLSKQQEISGFGSGDGRGDGGDDWVVECVSGSRGTAWKRGQRVRLYHVDTQKYLGGSTNVKFSQQNCGHSCPILNHLEAFGRKQRDDFSIVKVEIGIHLSL